jgi:hypothetical protein
MRSAATRAPANVSLYKSLFTALLSSHHSDRPLMMLNDILAHLHKTFLLVDTRIAVNIDILMPLMEKLVTNAFSFSERIINYGQYVDKMHLIEQG